MKYRITAMMMGRTIANTTTSTMIRMSFELSRGGA